jgi:small subunit ribosomal protein S20
MANIQSQIKRNRQNEKRRQRNKGVRTALKTGAKKVQTAAAEGQADVAREQAAATIRGLDKAAGKSVIHKNAAARRKSRLAKQVNRADAAG